jgi:hypothetical protein
MCSLKNLRDMFTNEGYQRMQQIFKRGADTEGAMI